jgi:putative aldouronate transport system substrate-binding protein
MRKTLSALFALVFALTLAAPGLAASGQIVDGVYRYDEPVDIRAMIAYNPSRIEDVNNMWLFHWARDKMNINFIFDATPQDSVEDQAPLRFAAGDYTEAVLYYQYFFAGLSDQAEYGDQEGILRPLNDYLFDKDVMPNMAEILEEFEDEVPFVSTLAGNIYNVPYVLQNREYATNMSFQPIWYDTRVLESLGVEAPSTTGELLDIARLIKEKDPKGLGENNIPIGGDALTPLLVAHGFRSSDTTGLYTLRDGDFRKGRIIAQQTAPEYLEYLRYANTLYEEGLIEQDYYTISSTERAAHAEQNHYTFWTSYNVLDLKEEDFTSYDILPPLLSEYNDNQEIPGSASTLASQYMFFLTDKATDEQAEAVMRFADMMYDKEFRYNAYYGPEAGVDDGYGLLEGWYIDEDGSTYRYKDVDSGKMDANATYLWNVGPIYVTGNILDRRTDGSEAALYNPGTRVGRMNAETVAKLSPNMIAGLPGRLYPDDVATEMSDLESVLNSYIRTEAARFVTGVRPLTDAEFAAYGAELEAMGYTRFVETYIENITKRFLE